MGALRELRRQLRQHRARSRAESVGGELRSVGGGLGTAVGNESLGGIDLNSEGLLPTVLHPLRSAAFSALVSALVAEVKSAEVPPPVTAPLARMGVKIKDVRPERDDAERERERAERALERRWLRRRGAGLLLRRVSHAQWPS